MVLKKTVVLKISGETLGGVGNQGFQSKSLGFIGEEVAGVASDYELAIVIGGGNIVRGGKLIDELGLRLHPEIGIHHAGMISTLTNAIILREFMLHNFDLQIRVLSAFNNAFVETFDPHTAKKYLRTGEIILLAGGTGNPFFSTDTAAVLRALELETDLVLKGTKVRGVFDCDPADDNDAEFFPNISYNDFLSMDLEVMDPSAICLARDYGIDIRVFNVFEEGNLEKALKGEIGSLIGLT